MSKYNPDHLQEMAKTVLANTGTMEYLALVNIVAGLIGMTIEEVVNKISELAKGENNEF